MSLRRIRRHRTPTTVAVTPTAATITTGAPTVQLTATCTNIYGGTVTNGLVTNGVWSSSNGTLATVSVAGLVTRVANGTPTVNFTTQNGVADATPTNITCNT